MRRIRRYALIGLAVLVGGVLAGWTGLRIFLATSHARSVAADRLTAIIGLPVVVDELTVGSSTSVSLRIVEAPDGGGSPAAEIARVTTASADVSVLDLIAGRASPKKIVLTGVTVTVAVDRDGRVLTPTPKSAAGEVPAFRPEIRIDDARVVVHQVGRPSFTLGGIRLTATATGDRYDLDGAVADDRWGNWSVRGAALTGEQTGFVELATADGTLDPDLLKSIPFVPSSTWDYVLATGRTPPDVRLESGSRESLAYSVTLRPAGSASVTIPDIDATLGGVAGTIRISGQKVEIDGGTATLAGGTVRVDGVMDFAPEPSRLSFRVSAEGVDVRRLPAEWSLPSQLGGRLRGRAELTLLIPSEGRIETRGGGEGTLDDATLAGLPAEVRLRLRSDGRRFRFDSEPRKDGTDWRVGPRRATAARPQRPTQPTEPPAKPDAEPTTLDATVTLRDIDVAELLSKLDVAISYRIAGRVTVRVAVSVPVGGVVDRRSYRFHGTLSAPFARFEDLEVRDLSADLRYRDGVLSLTALKGTLPGSAGGRFLGTATAQIEPRGDLAADIDLTNLPLEELAKGIPGGADLKGTVSGRAAFRAPVDRLTDPTAWDASASLTTATATIFGRSVRDATATARVDRGMLRLTDASATVESLPLKGEGTLVLQAPFRYEGFMRTTPTGVADLRRLVPEAEIPFAVEGNVATESKLSGTLDPFDISAAGTARVTDLKFGDTPANEVTFQWDWQKERFRIRELEARLFGGTVAGSAEVPLVETAAGKLAVEFKNVDTDAATKTVPNFPVPLAGRVSGKVTATAEVVARGGRRVVDADVDLAAPKLRVRGIPAERLAGKVTVTRGVATYTLEGHALGGTFDVKGTYPAKPKDPPDRRDRGHVRLRNLDLARLATALDQPGLGPLRGVVDVNFEYDAELTDGAGRVSVTGLKWGREVLGNDLTGSIDVRNGVIDVRDFGGRIAGGFMRVRARYDTADPRRNFYAVTLDRAVLRRLGELFPGLVGEADGEVTVTARGRFAGPTGGQIDLALSSAKIAGLAVTELRIPISWSGGLSSGRIAVRNATGRLGNGRVVADVEYDYGPVARLGGTIRFTDVRLQPLVGTANLFGNGRISGRFDLGGAAIRSIDDVQGTLTATLNQTSVREIPLLRAATPFLSPAGLLAPFEAGDVKGRLSGGVFRVERLALSNPGARVFAEGTVGRKGRVDLAVVAVTGQVGPNVRALRLLGLRIPAIGPIPLSIIQDVSVLLSNRTIRLTITGTVSTPIVKINTAAFLTETAVRFFLGRYVLPELPD